jgi:hypothetical protein
MKNSIIRKINLLSFSALFCFSILILTPVLLFADGNLDNVEDQFVNEGDTLSFFVGNNADTSVTYSLDTGTPPNAMIDQQGNFSFTPEENQGGNVYPVTILLFDNRQETNIGTSTFNVTVNETNSLPYDPIALSTSTDEDTAETIILDGSDNDDPAQTLLFGIVNPPQHGTLSEISGNAVTYTPNLNFYGEDSFSYEVNDGIASSSYPANVNITIYYVDDLPVITINGDNPMTLYVGGTFTDPGATAVDPDTNELVPLVTSGEVDPNTIGTYVLTYSTALRLIDVCDCNSFSSNNNFFGTSTTRTVNVIAQPSAPSPAPGGGGGPIFGTWSPNQSAPTPVSTTTGGTTTPPLPTPPPKPKNEVSIAWSTNIPSTSEVIYGLTSDGPFKLNISAINFGYPFKTKEDRSLVTKHNVSLPNLSIGKSYTVRVVSGAGNPTFGPEYTFTLNEDGTVTTSGASGGEIIIGGENKSSDVKVTDVRTNSLNGFIKDLESQQNSIATSSNNSDQTASAVSGLNTITWKDLFFSSFYSRVFNGIINLFK